MKAIAAFFVLAISGCISVANSQSGGTPTWEDRWAADNAKCGWQGNDIDIAVKAYVKCRCELQEQRGYKGLDCEFPPAKADKYIGASTCSTKRSTSPC